jgi:hypothetical protein
MFIRKRFSSTSRWTGTQRFSYQVLSYREDGKIKHRVICNLGRYATPEEALAVCEAKVKRWARREWHWRLEEARSHLKELKAVVKRRQRSVKAPRATSDTTASKANGRA